MNGLDLRSAKGIGKMFLADWQISGAEEVSTNGPPGLDDVATRRIPGSTHAVLYVLDAQTGKELWSSGSEITSWNHWSGLSLANGRVYIGTFDGNLYCYGIKK